MANHRIRELFRRGARRREEEYEDDFAEPVRTVSLRAHDGLFIDAVEWSDRRVSIDGQDLQPPGGFGGGSDYQYSYLVPAAHVPRLVAALGGDGGSDPLHLLKERAVEVLEYGRDAVTVDEDDDILPDVPTFGPGAWFVNHGIDYELVIR